MAPVAKEARTINRDVAQENEPLFSGAGRDRPRKRRLGKSKGAGVPQPDSVERCSPSKIGVRAHRELVTLATALDELLASRTLHTLDILMQRFKALEAAIQDGHWNLARHYELIPVTGAMLSREEERELATKAEVRQLKLKEAITKSGKANK